ncbi:MAG TPA: hypothetical protein P5511_09320, partial [Candidatus Goldiibacteriota bacterium]|nr:hypothetical protein [Candidatus Goldiibacteriota bacterium]
ETPTHTDSPTATVTMTVTPLPTCVNCVVKLVADNEQFVLAGPVQGFMSGGNWSIISRIQIPSYAGCSYDGPCCPCGGGDGGIVFSRGQGWSDQNGDIDISIGSTGLSTRVYWGGWTSTSKPMTINKGEWMAFAAVYSSSDNTLRFYINGLEVHSWNAGPWPETGNPNNHLLGGQYNPYYYDGRGVLVGQSDIFVGNEIWLKRALTPADIQAYNASVNSISPADADVVLWMKFTGDGPVDLSGHFTGMSTGNSPAIEDDASAFSAIPYPTDTATVTHTETQTATYTATEYISPTFTPTYTITPTPTP